MGRENKPCAVVEFSRSCYTFVHGEMNLSRKYQVIIKLFNKYPEKGAKPSKIIFEGDIKIKAAHSKWLSFFISKVIFLYRGHSQCEHWVTVFRTCAGFAELFPERIHT